MFDRLGRTMFRARRLVVVAWLLVLLCSIPFAPRASSALKGGGFANGTSETDQATALLVSDLGYYPSNLTVVFSSPTLRAEDPRFRRAMEAALAPVARLPKIARIDTYYHRPAGLDFQRMVSVDDHAALATLQYSVSFDQVQTLVPQVRTALQGSALQTYVTGDGAVFGDLQTLSGQDLQQVEKITLPVALLLLILVFGTLVAAAVPMVMGLFSVAPTLALLFALGHVTDLSIFSLNVTTMIGLGVGIDYALFVTSRFREEVYRRPLEDAVAIAMATAGRAVMFSGLTVMIGLSGLLLFHSMALRSIGLGGSLVVLVSVTAALTLLPAVLGLLGTRVDTLAIVPWRQGGESRFWHGLATRVMRRPWWVIVAVTIVVAVIASPFRLLHLNVPDATMLPKNVSSRVGFDMLDQRFEQRQNNPIVIVVQAHDDLLAPAAMGALYDYVHALFRLPNVVAAQSRSLVTIEPFSRSQYQQIERFRSYPQVARAIREYVGNNCTAISLQPRKGLTTSQIDQVITGARALPISTGLKHYVGGFDAGVMDYLDNLYGQFPVCILFVVAITYVVLLILLRSAILPLKAVLMNALSLLGAYGAVVWIFQQGHLSTFFNFSATGYVDEITPIITFCTLFGLSMDYEVFLLSRIREQYLRSGDNTAAVAAGLERTGRIITSAALVLVTVAGSFAFTDIVLIKAIGLGLAIAILLDATLIRCLLVPATMRVLGQWNWWLPRWLRPLLGGTIPIR